MQLLWHSESLQSSFSVMAVTFVTICTNRKTIQPSAMLTGATLPKGSITAVAETWRQRLELAPRVIRAKDLYQGRAFAEALVTSRHLGVVPWVISAGLGLVNGERLAPSYSLTLAKDSTDGLPQVISKGWSASSWWRLLAGKDRQTPMAELIRDGTDLVIIAVPATYLALVSEDLLSLDDSDLDRIRLIGPRRANPMPNRLRPVLMPYDERLDAAIPGTRGDFAQRAARHFVEKIFVHAPRASADRHALLVAEALNVLSPKSWPTRKTRTDDELIRVMLEHWADGGASASRMLRVLRDRLGFACEQQRCQRLYAIAAERRRP